MPLPIAVGGVSLSSEQLKSPFRPTFTEPSSTTKLEPQDRKRQIPCQSVTWAICPFNEWQARTVLSFYDDVNDSRNTSRKLPQKCRKRKQRRMVEIRVQISPLVRALSTKAYRETRYHLELFSWYSECRENEITSDNETNDAREMISSTDGYDECSSETSTDDEYRILQRKETHRQPQVVFSRDRRYLMVLFFHENNCRGDQKYQQIKYCTEKKKQKQHSAIIVFQLRKPQRSTAYFIDNQNKIPLPSYVANTVPANSSESGADHELNVHPNGSCSTEGSPVVATHPAFVSSCGGVTAICSFAGESTKSCVSRSHAAPRTSIFLAAKSDGTLNWVDAESAQIIATTALPQIDFQNQFVISMTASPNSTLESGLMALIIASYHSMVSRSESSSDLSDSLTPYAIDDNEGSVGVDDSFETTSGCESDENLYRTLVKTGDCVLAKWVLSSTTDDPLQDSRFDGSQVPNENQTSWDQPAGASGEEKEDRFRRKEYMDRFVLQEIQQKRRASTQSQTLSSNSVKGQNYFAPAERPLLVVLSDSVFPRQHSSSLDDTPGIPSMMMQVELLSKWSPPSGSKKNTECRIVDVSFGSIPTVLCVVYFQMNRDASSSPRQKMAQILTLSDNGMAGDRKGSDMIKPVISLYLSLDEVEQAPSVANLDQNTSFCNTDGNCRYEDDDEGYRSSGWNVNSDVSSNDVESEEGISEINSKMIRESRSFGIQHDPISDSFVISSIVRDNRGKKDFWVGCVWNWRANAIGWMVQHEVPTIPCSLRKGFEKNIGEIFVSRLYIGRGTQNGGGSYLVYINSSSQSDSSIAYRNGQSTNYYNSEVIETRKSIVPGAILSPSNSLNSSVFTERCSLLLAETRVSFPSVVSKDSDINVQELDWKISALPLSYITSQGPPLIAAIGFTQAKSIAVASTRGVCVMDTYQNKWKQFGSPMEEQSFSVISMTWWEGYSNGIKEYQREDLLVAITQKNSGEQFLSCWSSKRLDLMHQLMDTPELEWKPGESQDPEPSWGISLPKDIRVTNVVLLSDPDPDQSTDHKKPRRALVLVYSSNLECDYLIFQLQAFCNKVSSSHSSEPYIARRPFFVMAQNIIKANIDYKNCTGPVTSIFIASASFQFDLRQSKTKKNASETNAGDFIATLGVTRSPGGLEALSILKNGESCIVPLSRIEVSRYQLSDQIDTGGLSSDKHTQIFKYVWTIELMNGKILCWSVPSTTSFKSDPITALDIDAIITENTYFNFASTKRVNDLERPFVVCSENSTVKDERLIVGTLCEVGSVSDWAIQSTFGCQFDILLGHVPRVPFGCVLRCGQSCQKFASGQVGSIDNQDFSSNFVKIDSFSQSPFSITPPSFLIPMYTLFLEEASIRTDFQSKQRMSHIEKLKNCLQNIQRQVDCRLSFAQNLDSSVMALRLIIFRSIEMVAKMHKNHSKKPSDYAESKLLLSQSLLSTVIDAARRCMSELRFASIILEVGRQIEPSNLQHLFPLPLPHELAGVNCSRVICEARTVIDLFTICMNEGSLAASASALPLLTSTIQARYYCGLLLDEAIENFLRNTSTSQGNFDSTEEERRVLGDFFRFGMKLENAEIYEENLMTESKESKTSVDFTSADTIDRSLSNLSLAPDSPENMQRRSICSSSILNYIIPSSLRGESKKQRMEDAIRREASSFIERSLDEPILDFALLPDWDDSFVAPNSNSTDINSVAWLVGETLLDLLRAENSKNNWKVIAAFAKMILQDGVENSCSYDLFLDAAHKAQPIDILSIIPESYDVSNGIDENISSFIEEGMIASCMQISCVDARYIVDMSLLLIDRLDVLPSADIGDQISIQLTLVIIVMIASHMCGLSQHIQALMQQDSFLTKYYMRAIKQNNEQKES